MDLKTDPKTGKFVKGCKGPGRRPRVYEQRFQEAFAKNVSDADWKAIIRQAVDDAKEGDSVAREWLSKYLVGLPTQSFDVHSEDDNGNRGPALILLPDRLAGMVDGRDGVIVKEVPIKKRRTKDE